MKQGFHCRLSPETINRLRTLARVTRKSQSQLVDEAITNMVGSFDLTAYLSEMEQAARSLTG